MVRKTYRPVKRGRATDLASKPASGTNLGGARLATWLENDQPIARGIPAMLAGTTQFGSALGMRGAPVGPLVQRFVALGRVGKDERRHLKQRGGVRLHGFVVVVAQVLA